MEVEALKEKYRQINLTIIDLEKAKDQIDKMLDEITDAKILRQPIENEEKKKALLKISLFNLSTSLSSLQEILNEDF